MEGRLENSGRQWSSQQDWPPRTVKSSGRYVNRGKGNRADRLSDGRILLREDLEKRVGRKFEGRYLENKTKEKRGNCECQGEVEDESGG